MYRRWCSEKGVVKLGQPVPLSNFALALNSGSPHRRQVYTPFTFLLEENAAEGRFCAVLEQHVPFVLAEIGNQALKLVFAGGC